MSRKGSLEIWKDKAYPRLRDASQELKALGYLVANQQTDDAPIAMDTDVAEGLGKLLHHLGTRLGRLAIDLDEAAVTTTGDAKGH